MLKPSFESHTGVFSSSVWFVWAGDSRRSLHRGGCRFHRNEKAVQSRIDLNTGSERNMPRVFGSGRRSGLNASRRFTAMRSGLMNKKFNPEKTLQNIQNVVSCTVCFVTDISSIAPEIFCSVFKRTWQMDFAGFFFFFTVYFWPMNEGFVVVHFQSWAAFNQLFIFFLYF